ncbi:MAG: UPF0182 family protein [Acidobacteria bacterium]|nr:UPF0182 family protein [Acidobacteriota bacterium]
MSRSRFYLLVLGIILLVFLFAARFIGFYTDWLWFKEVGFEAVYIKVLLTKLSLGFGIGLVALGVVFGNLALALWVTREEAIVIKRGRDEHTPIPFPAHRMRQIAFWLSFFIALFIGLLAATEWQTVLQYIHRTPVPDRDPLFQREIGFYLFQLPVWEYLLGLGMGLVVVCLVGASIVYVLKGSLELSRRGLTWSRAAKVHLSILGSLLLLILAFNARLDILNLVYSPRGVVAGASYTDVHAELPLLRVLLGVALLGVLVLMSNCFIRTNRPVFVALGLYLLIVVVQWIYPASVQRFVVEPNEFNKETPYIERNIAATRRAFGLDKVEEQSLTGDEKLTYEDIQANATTINNVRLWDRDSLLDTFAQIQEIRTYYEFQSVNVDRYTINGEYRQVMLSPRELASELLPNRSWVNERLVFTHGYGLTLGPVNRVDSTGLPVLYIKNIPPVSEIDLKVQRPEIYFAEVSSDPVFVLTAQKEFNYPAGDDNIYTTYSGTGGVPMYSFLRKFMFAVRFGSLKILLSNDIKSESRVLFYRKITERVQRIAPFLHYDSDPYMVISKDGFLYWIIDAYTMSDRYPYSQPIGEGVNYIRNPVKVLIDAYNGWVRFYLSDPSDVLIQTYAKIFPGLFQPMDQMPPDLRAHIRYPSDLFSIQTRVYSTYHMGNPQVFYNKEDQWETPIYESEGKRIEIEPYHTIMKLPGQQREEFILMRPFTPRKKDNLAAWMVARNDGEHYGKLVGYAFPKQKLIYGPRQVNARINQEPEISRQLSLWGQRGSQVILGRLIVIPIEESLIYVRPLYLRAETGKIPELKRVIVAYENQIAMEETLEQSLAKIFQGAPTLAPPHAAAQPSEAPSATPASIETLAVRAKEHYDRALEALRAGDWARCGEEVKRLGEVISQMQRPR